MRAPVLLNSFNELRKRYQLRACRHLSLFGGNEFNKFNNIGARMLDSIFHMTFIYLKIAFLA